MLVIGIIVGWVACLVFALALCAAAARGDRQIGAKS